MDGSQVAVTCGGKEGIYSHSTGRVLCTCGECAGGAGPSRDPRRGGDGGSWFSPSGFEVHGGKAAAKKWKRSLKLKASGAPLEDWLAEQQPPSARKAAAAAVEGAGRETRGRSKLGGLDDRNLAGAVAHLPANPPPPGLLGEEPSGGSSGRGRSPSRSVPSTLPAGSPEGSPPPSDGALAATHEALAGLYAASEQEEERERAAAASGVEADAEDDAGEPAPVRGRRRPRVHPAAQLALALAVAPDDSQGDEQPPGSQAATADADEEEEETETEDKAPATGRRVLPHRAAAPAAGFGTKVRVIPPPKSERQLKAEREAAAAAQKRAGRRDGRTSTAPARAAAPAARRMAAPAGTGGARKRRQLRQLASPDEQPEEGEGHSAGEAAYQPLPKRGPGRPRKHPLPAAPREPEQPRVEVSAFASLQDMAGFKRGAEVTLLCHGGSGGSVAGGGSPGGPSDLLGRAAAAADEMGMQLTNFAASSPGQEGTAVQLQLWLPATGPALSGAAADDDPAEAGQQPAELTPRLVLELAARMRV